MMRKLVLEGAAEQDGRKTMSCARAFEIHRQHGVPLGEIGRICDENDIRICACQLGCFRQNVRRDAMGSRQMA